MLGPDRGAAKAVGMARRPATQKHNKSAS